MNNYYEKEYLPKMHRIGIVTNIIGVGLSFAPALALALCYGLLPDTGALATAFVTALVSFGTMWFVEPISYFPVVGPIGTYMAFLSGNISNMRVPCASMAQAAVGVEPGTEQGSVIATIGMAVSVIINISVLSVGVILGSSILSRMPAEVTHALNYLLPALFGALFMQFGLKQKGFSLSMLVFSICMYLAINAGLFSWLPGASNYLGTLSGIFVAVGVSLYRSGKKAEK